MHMRTLTFLVAVILVLAPVVAVAQAQGSQGAGVQGGAAAEGAGGQAGQGATAQGGQGAAAQAQTEQEGQAAPKISNIMGKKDKMAKKLAGAHDAKGCPCPYCPGKEDAKGAKTSEGQQAHMLMNAEISKNDPAAILSMKDDLKLTPEQTQQLQQIQAENRQKVEGLLNDAQKQQLAQLPAEATSMSSLHQQMMAKSGQQAGEAEPGAIDRPQESTAERSNAPAGGGQQ